MKRGSKLSGVLHVLLHMAEHRGPTTSEKLAKIMETNPVVIRRLMAGLRDRGWVHSEKGHGGGWTLAMDMSKVTLRDIYSAIDSPPLLAIHHRSGAPKCLVEQAVNSSLGDALTAAEDLLLRRFEKVTLARILIEVRLRARARKETIHV